MKISIIGSGNVATVLGRLLKQNGFVIEEIVSRNKTHAINLAKEMNAFAVDNISAISKKNDIYIVAVNDDAIKAVSNQLLVNKKIVVHTCGSASINVLKNASKNFGVLYPLQSLRKEIKYIPSIPFLIDGNNDYTKKKIFQLATSVSKNVKEANDEQRIQYHLSAVIVSNFNNHLFALTKRYCEANNNEFSLLLSLIEETVHRVHAYDPVEMQTGPAIRGDISTIKKHLNLLKDFPGLKKLYQVMSKSILALKRK